MRRKSHNLPHAVATVNAHVVASHVRAGVGGQVDVGALELLGVAVAAQRDHGEPEVLGVLVDEVRQTGVDVAGGDAVDTSEVSPLVGQRAGEVNAAGLGDVVGGLFLGKLAMWPDMDEVTMKLPVLRCLK